MRFSSRLLGRGLMCLGLLIGACNGCKGLLDKKKNGATATRAPVAWDVVLNEVKEDGSITKEGAIAAFSLHYGALPGVKDLPKRDASVPSCGTMALIWLQSHWDSLTEEQRAAALKARTPAGKPAATDPKNNVKNSVTLAGSTTDTAAANQLKTIAERMEAELARRLNFRLPRPVILELVNGLDPEQIAASPDTYFGIRNLRDVACKIQIPPTWINKPSPAREAVIAHEMMHCFQYAAFGEHDFWVAQFNQLRGSGSGDNARWGSMAWLLEGGARWAGGAIAGGSDGYWAATWGRYLTENIASDVPNAFPLFKSGYEAFTLFDYLARGGVDLWPRFRMTLGSHDPDGSLAVFLEDARAIAVDWTTGVVQQPSWGREFVARGSDLPVGAAGRETTVLPEPLSLTHPVPLSAGIGWQRGFTVGVDGGVEIIQGITSGIGRATFDGEATQTWLGSGNLFWCLKEGGCRCANGSPLPPMRQGRVAPTSLRALLFGTYREDSAVILKLTAYKLEDFCSRPQPDASPPPTPPAETSDAGPPPPIGNVDRCLVGRWQLDPRFARTAYQNRMGSAVTLTSVTGGQELAVNAGAAGRPGTFGHRMLPMSVKASASGRAFQVDFAGSASGTVRTAGVVSSGAGPSCTSRGVAHFADVQGTILPTAKVEGAGTTTAPLPDFGTMSGSARYEIAGGRLFMIPASDGVPTVWSRQ